MPHINQQCPKKKKNNHQLVHSFIQPSMHVLEAPLSCLSSFLLFPFPCFHARKAAVLLQHCVQSWRTMSCLPPSSPSTHPFCVSLLLLPSPSFSFLPTWCGGWVGGSESVCCSGPFFSSSRIAKSAALEKAKRPGRTNEAHALSLFVFPPPPHPHPRPSPPLSRPSAAPYFPSWMLARHA